MPRGPTYREHFMTVKIKKWSCNVCTGHRRRVMNRRQAKFHGGSAKHCLKEETATFFKHPGNFTTVEVSKLQCNICRRRRRPMTHKIAKLHERTSKHSSKVAATLFKHPKIFEYAGNGKWLCNICKTNAMTIKKAEAHEIRCQGVGTAENEEAELRSEGNNSTSSMHRASNNEEGDENDNEDEEEGDDDDDDGSDSDSGSDSNDAFVENFLRSQNVGASHRRRMRSFYKMPTDQKIQKIREVVDVIQAVISERTQSL